MDESQKPPSEHGEASAFDVEFLPLHLMHRIHRNLRSSQVEIVPQPYYFREATPDSEPEIQGEAEIEVPPPQVVYAPPLPEFKEKKNWWDFVNPIYSFNNTRIRSRVELLMTSRIVYVTDRKYMVRLQEKIKDDYTACLRRRMQERAADEIEREKNLLLEGKISFEEAPLELKNHPVCKINQLAQSIIKYKKAKTKIPDKTWAYKTEMRRIRIKERLMKETLREKEAEKYSDSNQLSQSVCIVDAKTSEDIEKGFMFSQEEYDKLKMEDPIIKLLREIDAVSEMYRLADEIIGETKVDPKSFYTEFYQRKRYSVCVRVLGGPEAAFVVPSCCV